MVRSIDPRRETSREVQRHNETAPTVWNSRRGNHLGQRSCATASKGRTYESKRSDQAAFKSLASGGRPHMDFASQGSNVVLRERLSGGPNASRTPLAVEPERGRGGDGAMLPRSNRQEANMTKLTTRKSHAPLDQADRHAADRVVPCGAARGRSGDLAGGHDGEGGPEARGDARREGARPGDQGEARHAGMEAQRGGSLPCADHHQARPGCDQGQRTIANRRMPILGVQASASTDKAASAQSERSTPRQGSKLSR